MTTFAQVAAVVFAACIFIGFVAGEWNGAFGGVLAAAAIVGGLLWALGGDE